MQDASLLRGRSGCHALSTLQAAALGNLEAQRTAGAERWGGRGWETSVGSGFPVFLPTICQNKSEPPADQNVSEGERKKILQKLKRKKKNTATNTKPESFPCLDLTDLRWTRSKGTLV